MRPLRLKTRGTHTLTELSFLSGVTRKFLKGLLNSNGVQTVRQGRNLVVSVKQLRQQIPDLWKSIPRSQADEDRHDRLRRRLAEGMLRPVTVACLARRQRMGRRKMLETLKVARVRLREMPGGALYIFEEEIQHLARADFIWRVVELMQTKGLSTDRLASLSKIDRARLSEILSGTLSPSPDVVRRIVDTLEVLPDELGA